MTAGNGAPPLGDPTGAVGTSTMPTGKGGSASMRQANGPELMISADPAPISNPAIEERREFGDDGTAVVLRL